MRSSKDFIEVHGLRTKNVLLINKNVIDFVIKNMDNPDEQRAIIEINSGDHTYKIECEESYKDVAEELLWCPYCDGK